MKPKKLNTLKKNKEFGFVYRRGARIKLKDFAFIYVKSKYGGLRAGFSVNKKVGNSVVRNKCRRRLKEALRLYLPEIRGNWSVVFSAYDTLGKSDFASIKNQMLKALTATDILKREN